MSENRWIYFVNVNGQTFQASSLRAFARIALFARWYCKTQRTSEGMDCRGYRLKGSLGFIRRPPVRSQAVRGTLRSSSGDAAELMLQKIGA